MRFNAKKNNSHLSKLFLFQFQDDLLGHFLVDVAVTAEGAGVFDVAVEILSNDLHRRERNISLLMDYAKK